MLIDLQELKTLLRIPPAETEGDSLLSYLIQGVDAGIKQYLKRNIEQAEYTEYYCGNAQNKLVLRNRPALVANMSVWFDPNGQYGRRADAFPPHTLQRDGYDYVLDSPDGVKSNSGLLIRLAGGPSGGVPGGPWAFELRKGTLTARLPPVWSVGFGNIKVTYTAGYAADEIPEDLKLAATSFAAWMRAVTPIGTPVTDANFASSVAQFLIRDARGVPELGSFVATFRRYREFSI